MSRNVVAGMLLLMFAGASAVTWGSLELHRARVAAELQADRLGALLDAVTKPKTEPHATCEKSASGLDHNVDMGPVVPCAKPEDGQCVGGVPLSVAEAHCKAGKP